MTSVTTHLLGMLVASTIGAAAPDQPNACGLLTTAEAAAAVGSPVKEGKLNPGGSMAGQGIEVTGCSYEAASRTELNVNLWRFSASAKDSLAIYVGLCKKKEQAAGLGDVACWYDERHQELQVLKGPTLIILQLNRRDASAALTTAAKQALTRLKQ